MSSPLPTGSCRTRPRTTIKVANFSLHAVNRASIQFDPIDQAVEKLWLNGVVVVAAAGNYAVDGQRAACSSRRATTRS
jgi:Subtilase family.